MKRNYLFTLVLSVFVLLCLTFSGVYATWNYFGLTNPSNNDMGVSMKSFRYGTLYITDVAIYDGSYSSADAHKSADLNISSDIVLNNTANSSAVFAVTFYNSTDVSYYYNKTETVSTNNDRIGYIVTGIEQKDEIPSKTFKTVYVTFAYTGNNTSNRTASSTVHFNFVVDQNSIGGIVAQTAVDRFNAILNNEAFENSYQTLTNGMDNRSGINKASAVTYIGNVSGSSSTDSRVIETLFGQEFMSMDLNGDGSPEPITMMIKRENLDNKTETGDSYSYTSWGREYIVNGVEMTLYITSDNLDNVSSGKSVVVYAASFTKPVGSDEWIQIVPLAKGSASANNYSGYGSANSFNTDTWKSDDQKTITELAQASNP